MSDTIKGKKVKAIIKESSEEKPERLVSSTKKRARIYSFFHKECGNFESEYYILYHALHSRFKHLPESVKSSLLGSPSDEKPNLINIFNTIREILEKEFESFQKKHLDKLCDNIKTLADKLSERNDRKIFYLVISELTKDLDGEKRKEVLDKIGLSDEERKELDGLSGEEAVEFLDKLILLSLLNAVERTMKLITRFKEGQEDEEISEKIGALGGAVFKLPRNEMKEALDIISDINDENALEKLYELTRLSEQFEEGTEVGAVKSDVVEVENVAADLYMLIKESEKDEKKEKTERNNDEEEVKESLVSEEGDYEFNSPEPLTQHSYTISEGEIDIDVETPQEVADKVLDRLSSIIEYEVSLQSSSSSPSSSSSSNPSKLKHIKNVILPELEKDVAVFSLFTEEFKNFNGIKPDTMDGICGKISDIKGTTLTSIISETMWKELGDMTTAIGAKRSSIEISECEIGKVSKFVSKFEGMARGEKEQSGKTVRLRHE